MDISHGITYCLIVQIPDQFGFQTILKVNSVCNFSMQNDKRSIHPCAGALMIASVICTVTELPRHHYNLSYNSTSVNDAAAT